MLPRIRAATRAPTPEERLADLIELHAERPGITEATLGAATTAEGRTGYEVLAGALPEGVRRVVELGCGNGPLLAAVLRARPAITSLVGVDACAADLERARARLPDPRLDLRCERADRLSLADGSADAVVAHHALYLFEPVEGVLAEVARVLASGGVLACVTWSFEAERHEPFARMVSAMGALAKQDVPHFTGWGDRRHFDRAAFEALLDAAGFETPMAIEEHALVMREPAAQIVARLAGFFYTVELMRDETRAELRATWTRMLAETIDAEGNATLVFPFALFRAQRR